MGKACAESKKEAKRRFLEKIKRDPAKYKAYCDEAAERMRRRREVISKLTKTNSKLLSEKRENDRIRQKKLRDRKRNDAKEKNTYIEPYTCKQTLGKAVKKAESALPVDLAKKVKVIETLSKKYVEPANATATITRHSLEMESQLNTVRDFYMREDISVQAAGRKDTLIVNGTIVAKRFMLVAVSEAYEVYKTELIGKCVSKSTFFQCRPRHIQLSSKMPHNMCVCIYHANFSFLLEGCAKVIKSFPTQFQIFLETVCCDIEDEKCMSNDCENCTHDLVNDIVPLEYFSKMDESVKWRHWRKVDDRIMLTDTVASLSDIIHELQMQLPLFKRHFFIKRAQQHYFETLKESIKDGDLVLQIDFAENYRLICQNEVQSAHFNYKQASIFTCVAWMFEKTKSYAVITDSLTHSKIDVYIFITNIVQEIIAQYGNFENIYFFSDGSSCQFKNKFIVWSLTDFLVQFGCNKIEWNYFATSHGKGAVDGVGAVIKRKVWGITKTKNIILTDGFSFFNCAREHIAAIHIIYIGSDTIKDMSPTLTEKWKDIPNILGIRKLHYFSCDEHLLIKSAQTAYSLKNNI